MTRSSSSLLQLYIASTSNLSATKRVTPRIWLPLHECCLVSFRTSDSPFVPTLTYGIFHSGPTAVPCVYKPRSDAAIKLIRDSANEHWWSGWYRFRTFSRLCFQIWTQIPPWNFYYFFFFSSHLSYPVIMLCAPDRLVTLVYSTVLIAVNPCLSSFSRFKCYQMYNIRMEDRRWPTPLRLVDKKHETESGIMRNVHYPMS